MSAEISTTDTLRDNYLKDESISSCFHLIIFSRISCEPFAVFILSRWKLLGHNVAKPWSKEELLYCIVFILKKSCHRISSSTFEDSFLSFLLHLHKIFGLLNITLSFSRESWHHYTRMRRAVNTEKALRKISRVFKKSFQVLKYNSCSKFLFIFNIKRTALQQRNTILWRWRMHSVICHITNKKL